MRIKTISVEYGRKFNLGNYNSADVKATAWADLETEQTMSADGAITESLTEDAAAAFAALFEQVKDEVRRQAQPFLLPQLKVIREQVESVKLSQEKLKEILVSLVTDGHVTISANTSEPTR